MEELEDRLHFFVEECDYLQVLTSSELPLLPGDFLLQEQQRLRCCLVSHRGSRSCVTCTMDSLEWVPR